MFVKVEIVFIFLFSDQIESLERIQEHVENKDKTKITTSELVRRAMEYGLPALSQELLEDNI